MRAGERTVTAHDACVGGVRSKTAPAAAAAAAAGLVRPGNRRHSGKLARAQGPKGVRSGRAGRGEQQQCLVRERRRQRGPVQRRGKLSHNSRGTWKHVRTTCSSGRERRENGGAHDRRRERQRARMRERVRAREARARKSAGRRDVRSRRERVAPMSASSSAGAAGMDARNSGAGRAPRLHTARTQPQPPQPSDVASRTAKVQSPPPPPSDVAFQAATDLGKTAVCCMVRNCSRLIYRCYVVPLLC